jgi:mono/diheme cytochrome c family protein
VPVSAVPGLRGPGYEIKEVIETTHVAESGTRRVVVEILVGSAKTRCEPGELCLAYRTPDGSYAVLGAEGGLPPVPLTDAAMEPEIQRVTTALNALDTENRRKAAASQDAFWEKRREAAQAWTRANRPPEIPAGAEHPVDAFLQSKIRSALEASARSSLEEARQFYSRVHSVLRDECFRCHGDKDKGGLRLNTPEAAAKAGESGNRAVVPGDPAASELIRRIRSRDEEERMPPKGSGLKADQVAILEDWIRSGALWPSPPVTQADVQTPPLLDDAAFVRKVWLDLAGVPPSEEDFARFLADSAADKRTREIDRLLAGSGWAHTWMPYWLDVLAENPTLINASLNSTGPFRWFLLEALEDNKPFDRLVTELVMMRGSPHTGGSAGFSIAGENDAPFATKGQILASAFLGIELQCARCHDSPYHSTKQADLFGIAAMLERKAVTVPKTSTVPAGFFEKKARESLIKVSIKPGEKIQPAWAFHEATGIPHSDSLDALSHAPGDTRARLAALLTAPENTRFAQMIVNRTWRRFIGAGFVEPVADWEGRRASHPELMQWLAHDFVRSGYDLKHLVRRIVTSDLYQREARGANQSASAELRFFNAPDRRRLSAENVVDSLFRASGQPMQVEELTFDPTGRRPEGARISLSRPTRAWMFANLTNDRDRPSLSLPYAQCVVDVLEAFGWSGARQAPRTDRETAPNVLQPGVLANGVLATTLTRASHGSALARLALEAASPEEIVERVFTRFLSRKPAPAEAAPFVQALRDGFERRILPSYQVTSPARPDPLPQLTWFNHLHPESSKIALQIDQRAHDGPHPDPRLEGAWRERFEDFVWSVLNTREFVWLP